MKRLFLALLLFFSLSSIANAHSYFTNEPAGATTIAECNLSSVASCNVAVNTVAIGRFSDIYGNLMNNPINDASEPASPPFGVQAVLPYSGPCAPGVGIFASCAVGGGQLTYIDNKPGRGLFLGATFKINTGYGCSSVGFSKVYFLRTVDNLFGKAVTNGIFGIRGCGPVKTWLFGHNTGGLDNSHTCGEAGATCFPNMGSGAVTEGQWTKIEAYVCASTCVTCRDGVVQWWVNGVEAGRYTNLNYGNGNVNQFDWNQTWDGYGNGQGFTRTVMQMTGHVYLSTTGNGGCVITSGGSTTPSPTPPPPPTGPVDSPVGPPPPPLG
jgi:hypothetical protein